MSEAAQPIVAKWRPSIGPPDTHEQAMQTLINCAREAGMSYEEAVCGYLRARGILRDDAEYMCAPMPEGWSPPSPGNAPNGDER